MNKKNNIDKGRFFEKIALSFLVKKGYKILDTNYHSRHKEIDIICEKNGIVHFVEVKGRTSNNYGEITETITNKKTSNLINAAMVWIIKDKREGIDWQIDFLGIEMSKKQRIRITFLENAINQL